MVELVVVKKAAIVKMCGFSFEKKCKMQDAKVVTVRVDERTLKCVGKGRLYRK